MSQKRSSLICWVVPGYCNGMSMIRGNTLYKSLRYVANLLTIHVQVRAALLSSSYFLHVDQQLYRDNNLGNSVYLSEDTWVYNISISSQAGRGFHSQKVFIARLVSIKRANILFFSFNIPNHVEIPANCFPWSPLAFMV